MPVLLLLSRLSDAGRGAVELDASAQYGLHPLQHGRVVEQEGKGLVLFEQLVDKLPAIPARAGRIEGRAQGLNLRLGDGVLDDEVAPLAEERYVLGDFGRQLGIEVLRIGRLRHVFRSTPVCITVAGWQNTYCAAGLLSTK